MAKINNSQKLYQAVDLYNNQAYEHPASCYKDSDKEVATNHYVLKLIETEKADLSYKDFRGFNALDLAYLRHHNEETKKCGCDTPEHAEADKILA